MIHCDRDVGNTEDGVSSSSIGKSLNSRYTRISTPHNNSCNLSVIHANCQSAMNKRSEVCDLIDSQKPHILALTEFGASADINDGELGIEGYSLYRGNHSSGGGGLGKGAALYVKDNLNHSACPSLDNVAFDCSTWSTILLAGGKRLLVGVVYRSPNSPESNNEKMMEVLRVASSMKYDYLLVCGDFNLPKIDWNGNRCLDTEASFSAAFLETIEQLGWYQHSKCNTRFRGTQSSCLDLIFTNEENMVGEVHELPPIGKSDHICQRWELTVREAILKNTTRIRPNFKRANWAGLKKEVKDFTIGPSEPVSIMMDRFTTMIDNAKNRHIPPCKPRSMKHRLPWMRGNRIKQQRLRKWRSWTRFKETGLPTEYDAYKMERNKLNDVIREARRQHEKRLISDLKGNPNLYHGHCRRTLKTKQGVTNVMDASGKLTETENETATALNTYYHSVFTKDDSEDPIPTFQDQTQEQISDITVSVEMVEEILVSLNANKAAGPDGVENRILKECAEEMSPSLQTIFRRSIDQGEVPGQWKVAHIVPIHKGGSKAIMANFRPVALTSAICKVLEKIICAAIMSFLTRNNLITPQQHGFVRGHSCQTNIMLCLERWTEFLDEGKSVDIAYFDYAKAFDKVSHRLLMVKLKAYGIGGKLLAWLEAWLTDRKQRVVMEWKKTTT